METESVLSKVVEQPCMTFLLKGCINSGKSTIFNAIFSRNLSKTSIKRQTMCQTILTEKVDAIGTDYEAIYAAISDENKRVYDSTERGNSVSVIQDIEREVEPVEGFLKRIPGLSYRFVETGK